LFHVSASVTGQSSRYEVFACIADWFCLVQFSFTPDRIKK